MSDCRISGAVSAYSNWGSAHAGGATGRLLDSTLYRIAVTGNVDASLSKGAVGIAAFTNPGFAGGVVGVTGFKAVRSVISQCYSTGTVSISAFPAAGVNTLYVGGIAGNVTSTDISDCYSAGAITAEGKLGPFNVGGIVGYCTRSSITKSYAAGTVTAEIQYDNNVKSKPHAAGIVGLMFAYADDDNTITGCAALSPKISWSKYSGDGVILQRIANFALFESGENIGKERYPQYNKFINNFANKDMVIDYQPSTTQAETLAEITLTKGTNTKDGQDIAAIPPALAFTSIGWSASVWKLENGKLPLLQWQ
jgi:hypothetical protein